MNQTLELLSPAKLNLFLHITGRRPDGYRPGMDVVHEEHGPGWVWGAGLGRVTVRFETAETGPGPVRTFAVDDPQLRPADD